MSQGGQEGGRRLVKSPGCYREMGTRKEGEKGKTRQQWGGDVEGTPQSRGGSLGFPQRCFGAPPEGFPSARALRAGREDAAGTGISGMSPCKAGTMMCPRVRCFCSSWSCRIPVMGIKPPCRPPWEQFWEEGSQKKWGKWNSVKRARGLSEKSSQSSLSPQGSLELGGSRPPSLSQMREFWRILALMQGKMTMDVLGWEARWLLGCGMEKWQPRAAW